MVRRNLSILLLTAVSLATVSAQENIVANLTARQLGPTVMGGRVADIAVYENEPRFFYVATASGGLWRTDNGGITMRPVLTNGPVPAMGAVAVSQKNPDVVWVGMGEASSRNSTSWGDGVYRSNDGGKTWESVGLKDTHHISSIIIDPKDENTVYVGGLGRLWGANEERGVFKTTDGGKTWKKILFVNNLTGPIDMVMDPSNPKIIFAAMWERMRYPWNWVSGGSGSGLYKSVDGGNTWKKITKGLPTDEGVMFGRIGLDFFHKNPNIMVATIEASVPAAETPAGEWRRTAVGGTFRSTDKGESWTRVNTLNPRPFYFSMPRQDPLDESRIYVFGVNVHLSDNKGEAFRVMPINDRVHVDYHAAWINPKDNNHMIVGNDGGVSQSRDRGLTWEHINSMDLGQFYAIGFDFRKPYYVYGGLQDNGSWGAATQNKRGGVIFADWFNVGGGDGFYVQVDPNDWRTVYSESQGGAVGRMNIQTGARASIRPNPRNTTPPIQANQVRFNWSTPIHISPHNSSTIYVGGNMLFKSINRGDAWQVISPDLTTNDPEKTRRPGFGSTTPEDTGAERHCTIITISESPMKAGLIWVGTDDGKVQVTQDGGITWTDVYGNLPEAPKGGWVSRVTASKYVEGRCFVTIDNHRLNDFKTYVYMTEDFGKTWKKINSNLPTEEPCHVIKEGTKNSSLLFLGTEYGLWVSVDRGATWTKFKAGFPTVPVHDLAIHPRDLDLIIGTHGRSIWTMNVSGLEELTADVMLKDVHLARPQNVLLLGGEDGSFGDGDRLWISRNSQPGLEVFYFLKADVTGDVKVEIQDPSGRSTGIEGNGVKSAGLNRVRIANVGRRLRPGDYRVVLKIGETEYTSTVTVEEANWER